MPSYIGTITEKREGKEHNAILHNGGLTLIFFMIRVMTR